MGIGIICFIYFCVKRKCFGVDDEEGKMTPIKDEVNVSESNSDVSFDFRNHSIASDFVNKPLIITKVEQNLNTTYNVGVYRDEKGRYRSIKDYRTMHTGQTLV